MAGPDGGVLLLLYAVDEIVAQKFWKVLPATVDNPIVQDTMYTPAGIDNVPYTCVVAMVKLAPFTNPAPLGAVKTYMYPIEPAVPVPVVALYVFALRLINWLTPSVRPESTLLFRLTPVVRTLDPTERTLDVMLSKVAARSPKMLVAEVAEPMLTIFALVDAFWMFKVAVRAALVNRLAIPPVLVVSKL